MRKNLALTLSTLLILSTAANAATINSTNKGKPAPKMSAKIETNYNANISTLKNIEYGNLRQAESRINSMLKSNPNDITAKSLKVLLMIKQNKLDAAQKEVNNLLKTYPQNADLHYAQGLIHLARLKSSNMDYQSNKDYLISSAKDQFTVTTLLNPKHYAAYNALGICELKMKNTEKAQEMFEKALSIDSQYANAVDNLGTIDYLRNNLNEAEAKFKKSIKLNPNNATAYYHLAQLANKRTDYSQALTYLNNAECINPNSSSILNN